MRILPRLKALARADVPVDALDSVRRVGIDAYDLVDELPRGPARLAAWNAYALQTYGDKLLAASETANYVPADTAFVSRRAYRLVGTCLECARQLASEPGNVSLSGIPDSLPRWHTPVRSHEQLVGMREALEALRTYVAFDLQTFATDDPSLTNWRERLAAIDTELETVDLLWIARPPAELRGGIGDALAKGLDKAFELGQLLANQPVPSPS
jgi:hypothetical protein